MEVWAWCGECDRWFYCEGWAEGADPPPTCPVCGTAPVAVEHRGDSSHAPPEAATGTA